MILNHKTSVGGFSRFKLFFYIKAEVPIICPPVAKGQLIGKDPDAGKDWRDKEKGATEGEMVGWHYWLNGREFEQTPGDSEGQGSLECCSPWVAKRQTQLSDWTTQLKWDFTLWINQWMYSKIRLNWQLLPFDLCRIYITFTMEVWLE